MKTRQKRCSTCGGGFIYQWDDLGEFYSDICIECMLNELREEEKVQDRALGEEWSKVVNIR